MILVKMTIPSVASINFWMPIAERRTKIYLVDSDYSFVGAWVEGTTQAMGSTQLALLYVASMGCYF